MFLEYDADRTDLDTLVFQNDCYAFIFTTAVDVLRAGWVLRYCEGEGDVNIELGILKRVRVRRLEREVINMG